MMLRHLTNIKIRKKMKAVSSIIDTGALVRNMRQIRKMAPNSKLLAVVKANAYGHGLYPVAAALKDDADAFAVSRIEEALSLRTQGITKPTFRFPLVIKLGLVLSKKTYHTKPNASLK